MGDKIPIEKLKILKLRLIDQSECTFLKCLSNVELSGSCGLRLVETIRNAKKGSNCLHKKSIDSVLFFNPVGHRALITNLEKNKELEKNKKVVNKSIPNTALKSKFRFSSLFNRTFYGYSGVKIDQMSYNEYLDCHKLLINQVKKWIDTK